LREVDAHLYGLASGLEDAAHLTVRNYPHLWGHLTHFRARSPLELVHRVAARNELSTFAYVQELLRQGP